MSRIRSLQIERTKSGTMGPYCDVSPMPPDEACISAWNSLRIVLTRNRSLFFLGSHVILYFNTSSVDFLKGRDCASIIGEVEAQSASYSLSLPRNFISFPSKSPLERRQN